MKLKYLDTLTNSPAIFLFFFKRNEIHTHLLTCHLLIFKHTTRVLSTAGGAWYSVSQRVPVGGPSTTEIPSLHHTSKTFSLTCATHIH